MIEQLITRTNTAARLGLNSTQVMQAVYRSADYDAVEAACFECSHHRPGMSCAAAASTCGCGDVTVMELVLSGRACPLPEPRWGALDLTAIMRRAGFEVALKDGQASGDQPPVEVKE